MNRRRLVGMTDHIPSPEWAHFEQRLQAALRSPDHRHVDPARATHHVLQAISQPEPLGRTSRRPSSARRWWTYGAAGLAAVLAVGVGISTMSNSTESDQPSLTYATHFGERAILRLPDGSQVTIAPRTILHYHTSAAGERLVALDGQALFTVRDNAAQPFIVHTGDISTRVLGTVFDIQAYAHDRTVQALLVSGKISIGRHQSMGQDTAHILTPGMLATLTDSSTVVSEPADPETLTDWVHGRLIFRNATIPEMLATVGRWSGYQFRVADSSLAQGRVTTTLIVGKPENTMRMLGDLLDATLTISDSTVTLHPRRSGAVRKTQPLLPGTPLHTTASGVGQ